MDADDQRKNPLGLEGDFSVNLETVRYMDKIIGKFVALSHGDLGLIWIIGIMPSQQSLPCPAYSQMIKEIKDRINFYSLVI